MCSSSEAIDVVTEARGVGCAGAYPVLCVDLYDTGDDNPLEIPIHAVCESGKCGTVPTRLCEKEGVDSSGL